MTDTSTPYFLADPYTEVTFLEAPEAPTVVSAFADFPMADMASAFDSTFSALFPVLSAHGVQPVGPAFSLQTRMPSETVDMEIGFPVDLALAEAVPTEAGLTLQPSRLPAGRVAIVSHLGSYDGLGGGLGRVHAGRRGGRPRAGSTVLGVLRDGAEPGGGSRVHAHRPGHPHQLT